MPRPLARTGPLSTLRPLGTTIENILEARVGKTGVRFAEVWEVIGYIEVTRNVFREDLKRVRMRRVPSGK